MTAKTTRPNGAFTAPMGHEAHAPDAEDHRDGPGALADQDDQGRGDGRPEAAQEVLRGFFGRDHPAGIFGRIAATASARKPAPQGSAPDPEARARGVPASPGCPGPEADRAAVPDRMPFVPSPVETVAKLGQPALRFFCRGHKGDPDISFAGVIAPDVARQVGAGQDPHPRFAPEFQCGRLAVIDRQPEEEAAAGGLIALQAREDPVGLARTSA